MPQWLACILVAAGVKFDSEWAESAHLSPARCEKNVGVSIFHSFCLEINKLKQSTPPPRKKKVKWLVLRDPIRKQPTVTQRHIERLIHKANITTVLTEATHHKLPTPRGNPTESHIYKRQYKFNNNVLIRMNLTVKENKHIFKKKICVWAIYVGLKLFFTHFFIVQPIPFFRLSVILTALLYSSPPLKLERERERVDWKMTIIIFPL